jgi:hypothetical protein
MQDSQTMRIWTCLELLHGQWNARNHQVRCTLRTELTLVDSLKDGDLQQIYVWWYNVASEYARRFLTFEDDRPIAISSCASKVRFLTNDTYVAGLWKADLLRGLNWSTPYISDDDRNGRQKIRKPSWSWLSFRHWGHGFSIDWETTLFNMGRKSVWPSGTAEIFRGETVFCIDSCIATPLDDRVPLGAVSEAELSVHGYLISDLKIVATDYEDFELVHPTEKNGGFRVTWDEIPKDMISVYVLPIWFGENRHAQDDNDYWINGLVVAHRQDNKYERIGHACFIPTTWIRKVTKQNIILV